VPAAPWLATSPAAAAADSDVDLAAEAAPLAAAAPDTAVTHRLFLDIGLCPEGIRTDRTLGDKSPYCTDPQPLGRITIDL
jgi:hypothetical protein